MGLGRRHSGEGGFGTRDLVEFRAELPTGRVGLGSVDKSEDVAEADGEEIDCIFDSSIVDLRHGAFKGGDEDNLTVMERCLIRGTKRGAGPSGGVLLMGDVSHGPGSLNQGNLIFGSGSITDVIEAQEERQELLSRV